MRNCMGQSGQGVEGERSSGGLGSSSNCVDRERALAVAGAQAIGAGIAAADDHHALAGGQNGLLAGTSSPSLRRFCCGRNSMAK